MNFTADESVDQPIVSRLRADGNLIEAVSELDPGITDDEVLSRVTAQGAVLLTADKDGTLNSFILQNCRYSSGYERW
jgi:hypothetical protein